jgi:putative membrane protein
MTLEALLSYLHLLAILSLVVFSSSEAALCRMEWMNDKVVERLVFVDRIYWAAVLLVVATGVARTWWGFKGTEWYWNNWLLLLKVALFTLVILMSIKPTTDFMGWRRQLRSHGRLPDAGQVVQTRRWVMTLAHVIALLPLPAVFLARGFGA